MALLMGEGAQASMQPVLLFIRMYTQRCHASRNSANESHLVFEAPHAVPAGMPCRKAPCKWVCRFEKEWGAHALPGLLLVALPCSRCWLHYSHQRPFSTLASPPFPRRQLQSLPDLPYLICSSSCSCSSISCHTIKSHSSSHQCVSQRLLPCQVLLDFTIHQLSCSPLDMWQATTVSYPQVHSHSLGCSWIPNNSSSICKKRRLG